MIPSKSLTTLVAQPPTRTKQSTQHSVLQKAHYFKSVFPSPQGCQRWTFPLTGSYLPASHCLLAISTRMQKKKSPWRERCQDEPSRLLIFPSEWEKMLFGNGSKLHWGEKNDPAFQQLWRVPQPKYGKFLKRSSASERCRLSPNW